MNFPSRRNFKLPYNVLLKSYKRRIAITEANHTQESIKKALFQKKNKQKNYTDHKLWFHGNVSCVSKTGSTTSSVGKMPESVRAKWCVACSLVTTSLFVDRNGKCMTSPDLLEMKKGKKEKKNLGSECNTRTCLFCKVCECFVVVAMFTATVVQTWCLASTLSEWSYGIHVLHSQKPQIRWALWDFLETLGGIFEEEVLSATWHEHSECWIVATGTELGLQEKKMKVQIHEFVYYICVHYVYSTVIILRK